MSSGKLVISRVPNQQITELDDLLDRMARVKSTNLPIRFDRSVLLRVALADFLEKYGANPGLLYQRLEGNEQDKS
ncbi:hypothetical protein [Rhodobacteraceae bacterium W635]|uniref:hypothetical protein n=1 Tax=Nioella halotolerans TaxID=2303578 RepID=UPI000E3C4330